MGLVGHRGLLFTPSNVSIACMNCLAQLVANVKLSILTIIYSMLEVKDTCVVDEKILPLKPKYFGLQTFLSRVKTTRAIPNRY